MESHTHRERLFNGGKIGEEMREEGEERVTHTQRKIIQWWKDRRGDERGGGGESHTHTQRKIIQ